MAVLSIENKEEGKKQITEFPHPKLKFSSNVHYYWCSLSQSIFLFNFNFFLCMVLWVTLSSKFCFKDFSICTRYIYEYNKKVMIIISVKHKELQAFKHAKKENGITTSLLYSRDFALLSILSIFNKNYFYVT